MRNRYQGKRKGYGYYSMNSTRACVVMVNTIKYSIYIGTYVFPMIDFTSIRFNSQFQDYQIPALTHFFEIDKTNASDQFYYIITMIVNNITINIGFNWY